MQQQVDGSWFLEVPLTHGHHQYLFLVDDTPTLDPNASGVARNERNERISLVAVSLIMKTESPLISEKTKTVMHFISPNLIIPWSMASRPRGLAGGLLLTACNRQVQAPPRPRPRSES